MPRKATTTPKKPVAPSEGLMDFEQFVAQKASTKKPNSGRTWVTLVLVILVIVLFGIMWLSLDKKVVAPALPYKVIYLDNNQSYYAKVVKEDDNYIYLDDVYYIQSQEKTIPAEKEGDKPQTVNVPVLVHRGQELQKPVGPLAISRSKVVAVEELGTDSEIYKEILASRAQ